MAIGAIWGEIWDASIWDTSIWSQTPVSGFTEVASSAQSMRQQAFRNKASSTGRYNEDLILAAKAYLGGSPTGNANEILSKWLSQKLSASGSLNELKAKAAANRGKSRWDDLDGDDINNLLQ